MPALGGGAGRAGAGGQRDRGTWTSQDALHRLASCGPGPAAPLLAACPGPLGTGSVAVNYWIVLTLAPGQLWCVVSQGVGVGVSDLSFLQPVTPRPESSALLPSL